MRVLTEDSSASSDDPVPLTDVKTAVLAKVLELCVADRGDALRARARVACSESARALSARVRVPPPTPTALPVLFLLPQLQAPPRQ